MRGTSEKVEKDSNGPNGYFEDCMPPANKAATERSFDALGRFLRYGAVALIIGAVLMMCASIGAFYLWKVSDKSVYNVHYSMTVNGKVKEGSLEIDSSNNLERFRTGSGGEGVEEVHDFQTGITGIHFFRGEKCYIKSQIKANLPEMGTPNKDPLMFDLTDEIMPVKFDEDSLIWVAADQPVKDTSFLSSKILSLCQDSPIYWLHPTYPKGLSSEDAHRNLADVDPIPAPHVAVVTDGDRRKRDTRQAKRPQLEELEAERNALSHSEADTGRGGEEESSEGSAYNPENPYQHKEGAGEQGAMNFDPMLDHLGICCSQCRRSYTHCQRVCEPLRGHWPWPYNYRGCQVACRVILPCRWWLARILGVV